MASRLAAVATLLLSPLSSAVSCGQATMCTDVAHESGDLVVCSSKNQAQIWNSTSGECSVSMDADLKVVSYMSMIFTLGVTPAVRYQIGTECWDYLPQSVAMSIIDSREHFVSSAMCDAHPSNSPSLGWEMRYDMKTSGYSDCEALIVLGNDHLASCMRLHADARALATLAYMFAVAIPVAVLLLILTCGCGCYEP